MAVVRYNPIRNFEVAQQRLNDMMSTFSVIVPTRK